jgi:hypothetical protein
MRGSKLSNGPWQRCAGPGFEEFRCSSANAGELIA